MHSKCSNGTRVELTRTDVACVYACMCVCVAFAFSFPYVRPGGLHVTFYSGDCDALHYETDNTQSEDTNTILADIQYVTPLWVKVTGNGGANNVQVGQYDGNNVDTM